MQPSYMRPLAMFPCRLHSKRCTYSLNNTVASFQCHLSVRCLPSGYCMTGNVKMMGLPILQVSKAIIIYSRSWFSSLSELILVLVSLQALPDKLSELLKTYQRSRVNILSVVCDDYQNTTENILSCKQLSCHLWKASSIYLQYFHAISV